MTLNFGALLTKPAARKDVQAFIQQPNLRSAAGIAGTLFNLPELRVSEARAAEPQVLPASTQRGTSPQDMGLVTNLRNNNQRTYTNYSGGGGGGGGGGGEGVINANASDLQAQADYEFEQAMNILGQQEAATRAEYGAEESRQTLEGEKATTRATEAKRAQISGLEAEQQVGEKTATSGLKQARDLFRQLQQQNIAQLSGLGISSSSVAEALAERLGVETAQRIAGVTGSLDEIRQNVAKEKTRVEEVFRGKLTEIQEGTKVAIDQVRAGLQNALASIAAERGRAATAKAQARTDIAIQARNAIQQIQLEAQQRAQAVSDAAARRSQALAEAEQFMFKSTDFTGIQNAIKNVTNLPNVAGFRVQPQLNYESVYGQPFVNVQGQYVPNEEDEEDLTF